MSIEGELAGLRQALELPIVGHPHRDRDLEQLRTLISMYTSEARAMIAELPDDA